MSIFNDGVGIRIENGYRRGSGWIDAHHARTTAGRARGQALANPLLGGKDTTHKASIGMGVVVACGRDSLREWDTYQYAHFVDSSKIECYETDDARRTMAPMRRQT